MILTWTTKDGRPVEVEITLITRTGSSRVHIVDVEARVAGEIVGRGRPQAVRNAGQIVACIESLGLTAERRAEVDAAIHAVDAADVEWHAMVASREAEGREYDESLAQVRKAMSY